MPCDITMSFGTNDCIVKWTDAYGVEIKEGSLITYCVRTSYGIDHYKARVYRTDDRYIYVEVDDNSRMKRRTRKTRLYATHNIIVYAQPHNGIMLNFDNSFTSVEALVV